MHRRGRPIAVFLLLFALAPAAGAVDEPEGEAALPRYRLGANGENATPAPDPDQPLTPYRIELVGPRLAPTACDIAPPPEYDPVRGVLLRYGGNWPDVVADLVAALTGDPHHDEVAYVVVSSSSVQQSAANHFASEGADLSKVQFTIQPTNSIWIRDYGPHYIWQGGADAIVDSHYYPTRPLDNFIPTLLADDFFLMPSYDMGLYYSGGNFQPGAGRQGFITSLIHADNPGFGDSFIAALYEEFQGVTTLHIMPQLPGSVDGTGHIDMWLYLVDEDTAIISEFQPGSNATAIQITNNAVPYMEDLGYEVFRVPAWNSAGVHYTYTNAFRVNDRIFVPVYGTLYGNGNPAYNVFDASAIDVWEAAAGPGVEIVPIDSYSIIPAAGAIHCIVMQVPRHVDPDPAACVTSPVGGELLVPNTTHEITWTATDDQSVDGVDLYYSLDGGASFPLEQQIAAGLPDTGRFAWAVPEVEDSEVRVRVVAHDGDSNAVVAESAADAAIATGVQHVYAFDTGAGTDKRVFGNQTTSWAVVDGIRRPASAGTELSAANYAKLAYSDATTANQSNRYVSPTPSGSAESTHVFELTIAEDPAEMLDVAILWEGYAEAATQMELYVWDYVANQWCDGRGNCGENRFADNFAGNRDERLTVHLRSDFSRYIDPTGQMTLLLYAERSADASYHDYFAVTVTWAPCLGADTDFDGHPDVCDNCPTVANPPQWDFDGDLHGNPCDCAASNAGAFADPFEIENVRLLADKSTLAWDSDAANSGPATVYDVMRGDLAELPVGSGAAEACLVPSGASTSLAGLADPLPGGGDYYLIRGSNLCGEGSYGSDSAGQPRETTVCP